MSFRESSAEALQVSVCRALPSWGRNPGAGASRDQPSPSDVADGDQLGTVMEERIETLCLNKKKD